MKNFTELCYEDDKATDRSMIALYMDDALSEEDLIRHLGKSPATYAIIALNRHILDDACYEISYPILISKKPIKQEKIDDIFIDLDKEIIDNETASKEHKAED